jgi:hypothetical protein
MQGKARLPRPGWIKEAMKRKLGEDDLLLTIFDLHQSKLDRDELPKR